MANLYIQKWIHWVFPRLNSLTIDAHLLTDTSVIPDAVVRVISHCKPAESWEFGFVTNPFGAENLVSFGVSTMVQTTSLSILEAASEGRVTPLRLWRWVMSAGQHHGYAMESFIEYGGPDLEQFPAPFPGFRDEDIIRLFRSSTLTDDEILEELIYRGRFWVWMRPDRYISPKTR